LPECVPEWLRDDGPLEVVVVVLPDVVVVAVVPVLDESDAALASVAPAPAKIPTAPMVSSVRRSRFICSPPLAVETVACLFSEPARPEEGVWSGCGSAVRC
jgi:hypothetical protein